MSHQQYTTPVNAPTPPDAAACEAREQRRRKLEQEIDMLYGQITPAITAAPMKPAMKAKSPVTEEEVRETAWNLCKDFHLAGAWRHQDVTRLRNHVSIGIEQRYGSDVENLHRDAWQWEVAEFIRKYWQSADAGQEAK